jgi:hypothetical protein
MNKFIDHLHVVTTNSYNTIAIPITRTHSPMPSVCY